MAMQDEPLFMPGTRVFVNNDPGRPGEVTGKTMKAGTIKMVEIRYPDGGTEFHPDFNLMRIPVNAQTLSEVFSAGSFGRARDLQRVVTYEKLKGALHEIVYSMEAAQIDFYPYQFKPVLKIINAPTERLILADEVGLGKTIESALVWLELQARRQAKRLLVVCPRSLAKKWQDELRWKFQIDARIVSFSGFKEEMVIMEQRGAHHAFSLIATYTGLRPPKAELRLLDEPPGTEETGAERTEVLRKLRHNLWEYDPFDLVIFDEAHYMRHQATTTFHLGEALVACSGAVLCVSATPVHNSNKDLHSLLRLVDDSFFETQGLFDELLAVNRPAVIAMNALSRVPVDREALMPALEQMAKSRFIRETPLYEKFARMCAELDVQNKAALAKCQDVAERLNLLGGYVNRTRRVQVEADRPVREPVALAIDFTPEEMQLYKTILQLVRERSRREMTPFYVFQIMGLQLRAASCLPVLAEEIREGCLGDPMELMSEACGDVVFDDFSENGLQEELAVLDIDALFGYDFELHDSKYQALYEMLTQQITDAKVIIFAYYRPTLAYLKRRLAEHGLSVIDIHGGIPAEERWDRLDRFRNPTGPRILLSSEVGSEGIDLQFCRIVVNYDLPWNPMRVEQRIGRIDRVGQQAKHLAIVNFKIRGTIEERLYTRLHEKLMCIRGSLGDIEDVVGKEIQDLTRELLSNELTPDQEALRIEQTELAIENQLVSITQLEESGETLVAFSDYLQRRIDETRGKGRFMQAEELEDYVRDFFRREFHGCEVLENTPREGCMRIRLNMEARESLADYIGNDMSPAALPFRQQKFILCFRREIMQRLTQTDKKEIHFANHLCPLIKWITKRNQLADSAFYNVSALTLETDRLKPGYYSYLVARWKIKGLSQEERLVYAVVGVDTDVIFSENDAEDIFQLLLRKGKDWNDANLDTETLGRCYQKMEAMVDDQFKAAVEDFEAKNATAVQISEQRTRVFFERRIAQDEQRLMTMRQRNPAAPTLPAMEGRLQKARDNMDIKMKKLNNSRQITPEFAHVAAGVFRVV